ncbi:MAG: Na/Pi cotransporter family protein [Ruminococcus sp.]|nr:Na/Pi cotransporter family protein [Ruminococcus sp.]
MDMSTVFLLFGGLGLFLFGMKLMSDGLEQMAGDRMRSVLEFFTKNRFIGTMVGIIFTGIIQSSNATTVMVVSFVNSGLMDLYQATGVILGANIGTTVTGQLIAFNLSDIAPLFVIIGVVMYMFLNKKWVKKLGVVILGFGILFMGLSTMSNAMTLLKESPQLVSLVQLLKSNLLAVFVGFCVTAVLQSSSAAVGILMLMVGQGLVPYELSFFLIMGCNMGSCVSALVVSLSGKKDAKRAASIHALFNVIGTIIVYVILMIGLRPIADGLLAFSGGDLSRAVANANSLIKIFEVIVLFPFMGWIVKATYLIIPGEDAKPEDAFELKYIGKGTMTTSTTAVIDAIHELQHMGEVALNNLRLSMEALAGKDEQKARIVYKQEAYIDYMNQEITNYLVKINEMDLPSADAKKLGGLFHVVNDIERIGDHAENFADSAMERINKKISFSEKAVKQLQEMTEMVLKVLEYSLDMFSNQNLEHMREIVRLEDAVDEYEKKLQRSHVKRLSKEKCTPEAGMLYSDALSGLERVADHATNIAFAIMESESVDDFEDDGEV